MNVAIVVAAGKGTRLGGDRPKQFLELAGVPIIVHALRQFERCREISEVVTVLPAEETAGFESAVNRFNLQKVKRVIAGGATRAQSVRRGLESIADANIIAIHDGVRPFVTPDEIDRVVQAAEQNEAAILTATVSDTIKRIEANRIVETLPRAELRRALTPQCFRCALIKRAYQDLDALEAEGHDVTDDSLLIERLGIEVVSVEGSARNIKITKEEDLKIAEAFLGTFH
jgi:2-C-methyl-D-erythritol 4-phosphate cytidylyltransferase